jgi:succinylglutamic semialdehyde dehydrogenase
MIGERPAEPGMDQGELRVASPGDLDAAPRVFAWSLGAARSAVQRAREAQPGWERTPLPDRLALLRRLRDRFTAHEGDFARLLGVEVGKPLWEGIQEARLLANKVEVTLDQGLQLVAPHRPPGIDGEWVYRPHGVLAVLGPFNFPVHLPNGHVLPALALGNTVVFKPSELTPEVGQLYDGCFVEAGFPAGVFQVVQGERSVGEYLSGEAAVDGVLFTGSVAVGAAIARANASRPGRILALELGGKNAALVFGDADLDRAAYQIAYGAYVTAGQRCSSTSRCLVERGVAAELQSRLADLARRLRVGHFEDPQAFAGPLVSATAKESYLAAVRASGAEPIVAPAEAAVTGKRGHYLRPSLHRVERRVQGNRYQEAELFGPDLALYVFDDEPGAVQLANDTSFGLCASVFTSDRSRFERLARELRAGVINWNSPTVGASGKLPFGGIGNSGNHRPAGVFSSLYCAWPAAISFGLAGPTPEAPSPGL